MQQKQGHKPLSIESHRENSQRTQGWLYLHLFYEDRTKRAAKAPSSACLTGLEK